MQIRCEPAVRYSRVNTKGWQPFISDQIDFTALLTHQFHLPYAVRIGRFQYGPRKPECTALGTDAECIYWCGALIALPARAATSAAQA